MGEARSADDLVLGTDVVPDVYGDHGCRLIFVKNDAEAIVETIFLYLKSRQIPAVLCENCCGHDECQHQRADNYLLDTHFNKLLMLAVRCEVPMPARRQELVGERAASFLFKLLRG